MKLTKKEKEYVKKIKYTNNYMDTKKTFKKKIISTFEIQRIEEEIYNKTDKDKPFNKKLINVLNYQRRMKHKGKKYPHNIIIDYKALGFIESNEIEKTEEEYDFTQSEDFNEDEEVKEKLSNFFS